MDDRNQSPSPAETQPRKTWETPVLIIEDMDEVTQGGAFNTNDQDDMFYHS